MRFNPSIVGIFAVFGLSLFGCGEDSKPTPTALINGAVIDSESGQAVPGASIKVYQTTPVTTETDENGGFQVTDARLRENLLITASAEGYQLGRAELEFDPEAEQDTYTVVIELQPVTSTAVPMNGVVVDQVTGGPIAGATVTVYESETQTTETGEDGSFGIMLNQSGQVQVRVEAETYEPHLVSVTVIPGLNRVIQIEMSPNSALKPRLVGTVTDAGTGAPIAEVDITLFQQSDTQTAASGDDGTFSFENLTVGTYLIRANKSGYRPSVAAPVEILGPDENGLAQTSFSNLALEKIEDALVPSLITRKIAGHIMVSAQRDVGADSEVLLLGAVDADEDGTADATGVVRRTQTIANGFFEFADVPFPQIDSQYFVLATTHDEDRTEGGGDSWADTGIAISNPICLYGQTNGAPCAADANVQNYSLNPNGITGLENLTLQLEPPQRQMVQSNVCSGDIVGDGDIWLTSGEDLYLLFDSSVDLSRSVFRLFGPDNEEIATTVSANSDQDGEGGQQFLVVISPVEAIPPSDNPNDLYTLRIQGLVFTDGTLFTFEDAVADPRQTGTGPTCEFNVGTPLREFIDDPAPLQSLLTIDGILADRVVNDADMTYYLNALGDQIAASGYENLLLEWAPVPGATAYVVYGKSSAAPNPTWVELQTDQRFLEADVIHMDVNLRNLARGEPTGLEGGDKTLSDGNAITILVNSVDAAGRQTPITGTETTLTIRDESDPYLQRIAISTSQNAEPGLTAHFDVEVLVSESVDTSVDISTPKLVSGRLVDLSAVDAELAYDFDGVGLGAVRTITMDGLSVAVKSPGAADISGCDYDPLAGLDGPDADPGFNVGDDDVENDDAGVIDDLLDDPEGEVEPPEDVEVLPLIADEPVVCDAILGANEIGAGFDINLVYIGMRLGVYDPGVVASTQTLINGGYAVPDPTAPETVIIPPFVSYVTVAGVNTDPPTITLSGDTVNNLNRFSDPALGLNLQDRGFDSGDRIFDPNSRVDRLAEEALAGQNRVVVNDGSKFMIGQAIVIGEVAPEDVGFQLEFIESIDGNALVLAEDIDASHPINATVRDAVSQVYSMRSISELTDIRGVAEPLLSTRITSGSTNLVFRTNEADNPFIGVSVGDMVLLDADGDRATSSDQAWGTVRMIKTVDQLGNAILENGLTAQRLELEGVTVASGANNMDFDPSVATVHAMGDSLLFDAADLVDSSGNGPLDPQRNRGSGLIIWGE